METRQITQVKVYKLVLNPMRGNTENASMMAIALDKQKLLQWYESQKAPAPFVEAGSGSFECHGGSHNWHKTFNSGSPLEWCNPMDSIEPNHYGHGIQEEWVTEDSLNRFRRNGNSGIPFIE